jgi:hypothetical protein
MNTISGNIGVGSLRIGQHVRMADSCPYIGDWRGWTGFVSGIRADNRTGRISYEVSEVWPPDERSGRTDGCYDLTAIEKD